MCKKILVTGAGGYIGRLVVAELLKQGYHVLALDVKTDGIDSRAEICKIDLFNGDKNVFEQTNKPDICIHLAWRNGFVHNADSHIEELSDHYIFLKNMIDGGLKHLVVMGTMHEIGYWEGEITETTPANPVSKYGIAKNCLRQAMFNYIQDKQDVTFQWLRAYYITGDDEKNHSIFSKIIQAEKEGKEFFPFTSGKNFYDFIDVHDLAIQIALASCQKNVSGIIECCSGKPITLAEKVESFINDNNLKIKLQYGAFPDRIYDSPGVWGSIEKLQCIFKLSNRKVENEK